MAEQILTAEYIEAHLGSVPTAESWGRSIAEQVLRAAQKKIREGEGSREDAVEIDMRFKITPYAPYGVLRPTCISICFWSYGEWICFYPCVRLENPPQIK